MTLRIPYLIAAVIAVVSVVYLANPPGLRAAPVLTVSSLEGEQINLAAIDGKARLVTFISPDCPVTKKNLPIIKAVQDQFGAEALEVVGITMPYDQVTDVQGFRDARDIDFQLVADTDGSIAEAFAKVRFTPTSFLIDGQGNVTRRIVGRLRADELHGQINALPHSLAQKSVSLEKPD